MAERSVTTSTLTTTLSSEVVGRAAELARLREALDAATRGHGGVVFVVGEAGIGKPRLVEVIAGKAVEYGMPVLRGRAVQGRTPTAYRPLAEALCSAVRAGAAPHAADLRPFRATLGRLIPEWRTDEPAPLDESMIAVAEGVLRFLTSTAGDSGVLLALEDLHWSDPETLTIVEYLADNLAAERVLCLVTVRDDERSPGLALARSLCEIVSVGRDDRSFGFRHALSRDAVLAELFPPELEAWSRRAWRQWRRRIRAWTRSGADARRGSTSARVVRRGVDVRERRRPRRPAVRAPPVRRDARLRTAGRREPP